MIQILLVDDHPSVMEGTKMLLEQEGDMEVKLADSSEQALEMLKTQHFDVMLLDLHMPDSNGIDLAKKVLNMTPGVTILIYTGFEFKNHFNLMIEAGISGFVLKTANKEQLVTAVRCALRGEVILPLSLVKQLRKTTVQVSKAENDIETNVISSKEYEILKEIAKGKSNKDIAEKLITSQRSLEYALTNLFQKLNVKSRIEAAMKAKQMGLLSDSDFQ
ncbi:MULTISPECIES: response regulator transcription factor [unclassified Paenibacillus]|uniref:response regulator transcription factor n=1 Tax=unclassified Paenibacillus TaxID=185978 RepID=UPI001AE961A3|nr:MULTISPECIES: response regulator transcription factor [unclassified Paenibacillus]MBP1154510.1 two-component system competent response regulator ComA [Paenibacillus sp. PvP091]MBP1170106.1 two-component system competent response regulator ComA [Paenibacillus sp. PvR098]MBP2441134.1 two-component system competent response regulator ComA [Paenibacillus sp. PvP052]